MDSLKFIETMSVADFKAKMGVERIDVKQNPNTGKCRGQDKKKSP